MRSTAVLAAMLLICVPALPAFAQNLLANGNFETGTTANWTYWTASWGSGQQYGVQSAVKYEGTYALKEWFNSGGSGSFGVYQTVNVQAGKTYKVSGWWKGWYNTAISGNWIEVLLIDGVFSVYQADDPTVVKNNFLAAYDPMTKIFDWEPISNAYYTGPYIHDGMRTATGTKMTVVLKIGGFGTPIGYFDAMTMELVDTTPPAISNVRADQIGTTSAAILWSTDEVATSQVDYGVSPYDYQTPLDPQLTTSHGVSLSNLLPGTTYHYRVRSKDAAGNEAISGDRTFTTAYPTYCLPAAKRLADGSPVSISGLVSTAIFTGVFYAETADRACGIRVEMPGHTIAAARLVNITGRIRTNAAGERYIEAASAADTGAAAITPCVLTDLAVGGADFVDPVTGNGQRGVKAWTWSDSGGGPVRGAMADVAGANNIGLMIKVCGSVVSTGSGYFYLDGGSGFRSGDPAFPGVKVLLPSGVSTPMLGSYVAVTAASSCYKSDGIMCRLLRVARAEDVTPIP